MKCNLYIVFKSLILTAALILNLVLISIPKYFSALSGNIKFGLLAAGANNTLTSYSDFSKSCSSYEVPLKICDNVSRISKAGQILLSFLCLDICIILFYSAVFYVQVFVANKIVLRKQESFKASEAEITVLRFCDRMKGVAIAHPFAIIFGSVLWVNISNIQEYSSLIAIETGMVVVIVQCFFSLLTVAGFVWEIKSKQRRDARFKSTLKMSKYAEKQENKKARSDNTLEKSYEI